MCVMVSGWYGKWLGAKLLARISGHDAGLLKLITC